MTVNWTRLGIRLRRGIVAAVVSAVVAEVTEMLSGRGET